MRQTITSRISGHNLALADWHYSALVLPFNWMDQGLSEIARTAADLLAPPHLVTRRASKGIHNQNLL